MADLQARITKLEQYPGSRRGQWREYLSPHFAGPQYDGHREAIIAALCSDRPQYSFQVESDPDEGGRSTYFLVTWWTRDELGKPDGAGWDLAVLSPPSVRTYPGVLGEHV